MYRINAISVAILVTLVMIFAVLPMQAQELEIDGDTTAVLKLTANDYTWYLVNDADDSNKLHIGTGDDPSANRKITILTDGKVGIGWASFWDSPDKKFCIGGYLGIGDPTQAASSESYIGRNGAKFTRLSMKEDLMRLLIGDDTDNGKTLLELNQTEVVVNNESSSDVDFRVRSSGNDNMLFVDGGQNLVGIGTNSPGVALDVAGAISASGDITSGNDYYISEDGVIRVTGESEYISINGSEDSMTLYATYVDIPNMLRMLGDSGGNTYLQLQEDRIHLYAGGSSLIDADQDEGYVTINQSGQNINTIIEGDTDLSLFVADASADKIGIGLSAPEEKLHVSGSIKVTEEILSGSGSASTPGYTFASDTDTDTGMYRSAEDALAFSTDGTKRATVDNDGITIENLLIMKQIVGDHPPAATGEAILYAAEEPIPDPRPLPFSPGGPLSEEHVTVEEETQMWVSDSNGNNTVISPHRFELCQPGEDDPLPWSFYSRNSFIGKKINVDMSGAILALEELANKQFIFTEYLPEDEIVNYDEWVTSETQRLKYEAKLEYIAEHPWIEITLEEALEEVEEMKEVEVQEMVTKYRINYQTKKIEEYEVEETVIKMQPTGQMVFQLKADTRFDETEGKVYRRRTIDDVTSVAEPEVGVSQYVLDRLYFGSKSK